MAENKSSFILYTDQENLFEQLTDEEAGKLIKHIFQYVNDKDPQLTDRVLQIAFTPIKGQLKRDLNKWEGTREHRRESGRLGGIKSGKSRKTKQNEANEANASKTKQNEANEAVNVNDNVTVTVNENKEKIDKKEKGKFLVQDMFCVFQKTIPTYPGDVEMDFKPLLSIADFICKQNKKDRPVENYDLVMEKWEGLCNTIKTGWYKDKDLDTIAKKIQTIYQQTTPVKVYRKSALPNNEW